MDFSRSENLTWVCLEETSQGCTSGARGRGRPMLPFHHVKDKVKFVDKGVWFGGQALCSWSSHGGSFAHLGALSAVPLATGFRYAYADSSDEGFHARAMSAMRPQMPEALNLSTFVGELKELKGLFRRFQRKYWVRPKERKGSVAYEERISAGELLADNRPDDVWLEYQFGWRPFLTDCLSILVGMDIFEANLSRFLARQGRWIVSHYGEKEDLSPVRTVHHVYSDANWNYWIERLVEPSERVRTATLYQRYRVPDAYTSETRLWALLDSLGMVKGLSTLYELSPWSFMIDWFADVGGYISRNTEKQLETEVILGGYCFSKKYEFRERVNYHVQATNPQVFAGGGGTIMDRHYSFYERTPMAPPVTAGDEILSGTGWKWITGTALGTTRIRPRWRPKLKKR